MRSRFLPLVLITAVLAIALAALSYFQPWKEMAGGGDTQQSASPNNEPESNSQEDDKNALTAKKATNMNPDLTLDDTGLSKATAIISTDRGIIKFKFYPKDAPTTIARVIELINSGFYDGLIFHRVIPGFVIQTGDPRGDGTGGSGQKLKAEFNTRRHIEGTVAMARAADPDSADSQFYITHSPQPHLDNNYTVFGQVIEGMEVVRAIQPGDKMTSVVIE